MSRIERILVVDAGMAGLALAISLRRQGVSPHIVERQQDWSVPGAGIYRRQRDARTRIAGPGRGGPARQRVDPDADHP
jgi:cation diffusion facilitator CzcD-associated flavoprotein CzcO